MPPRGGAALPRLCQISHLGSTCYSEPDCCVLQFGDQRVPRPQRMQTTNYPGVANPTALVGSKLTKRLTVADKARFMEAQHISTSLGA